MFKRPTWLLIAFLACMLVVPVQGAIVIGPGEVDGISPVITVDTLGAQRETFIEINPANNLNLIMGWNERSAGTMSGQGFNASFDYGATWAAASGEISDAALGHSDPAILFSPTGGALGTAVFNYIHNDFTGVRGRISTDGGATFPGPAVIIQPDTGAFPAGIDKNWCTTDLGSVAGFDNMYVTVTEFTGTAATEPEDTIVMAVSFDQGATWPVQSVPLDTPGDFLVVTGSNVAAFASNGNTPVVWWEGPGPTPMPFDIQFSTRAVGGGAAVFGPASVPLGEPVVPTLLTPIPMIAADFYGSLDNGGGASFRVNSFPYIAIDNNPASPFFLTVYVLSTNSTAAAAGAGTDPDVMVWTYFLNFLPPTLTGAAVRNGFPILNDDGTTQDQVFPSITVAPDGTGTVEVFWLDTRNDPGGGPPRARFDIYYTCSVDGGASWAANTRISPATFTHASNTFIGDYDDSTTNRGAASGGGGHTWRAYVVQDATPPGTNPVVQAVNNTGPTAFVTGPVTIEDCTTPGGFVATYDASATFDVDDDPITYTWDVTTSNPTPGYPIVGMSTGMTPTLMIPIPFSPPSPNTYTVTVTATDFFGGTGVAMTTTDVIDTTPPVVTCTLPRLVLWPPYGVLMPVGYAFTAMDECDPTPTNTVSVYSSEPNGAAPFTPDALLIPPAMLRIRSERAYPPPGPGRVYIVVTNSVDDSGNRGVACCSTVVPTIPTGMNIMSLYATAAAGVAACLASPVDVAPPQAPSTILFAAPLP